MHTTRTLDPRNDVGSHRSAQDLLSADRLIAKHHCIRLAGFLGKEKQLVLLLHPGTQHLLGILTD